MCFTQSCFSQQSWMLFLLSVQQTHNSKLNILVTECLVKSLSFTRLISVIVIICAIQAAERPSPTDATEQPARESGEGCWKSKRSRYGSKPYKQRCQGKSREWVAGVDEYGLIIIRPWKWRRPLLMRFCILSDVKGLLILLSIVILLLAQQRSAVSFRGFALRPILLSVSRPIRLIALALWHSLAIHTA